MNPTSILNHWEHYEKNVVPKSASAMQRQELRRAFYTGILAIIKMQIKLGNPDTDEILTNQVLKGWHKELDEFVSEMKLRAAH